jgi:hypothetical protein
MVKLAFWDTVGEAYRFVFTQPLTILRAGWAVLAIDFVNLLLPAAGIKSAALQVLLAVIVYVLFIGIAVAALAYRQIAANWNPPPAIAARLET